MDYNDYRLLKNFDKQHCWFRAKKKLISAMLSSVCLELEPDRRILDIGSGIGDEVAEIKKFGKVTCLEKNEKALSILKSMAEAVIFTDLEKYDLDNNYYDIICCFDVLEHLNNDVKILEKFYSALKPGGYLLFTVPAYQILFGPHDLALEHKRRYGHREIIDKIKNSGLIINKVFYWNSLMLPFIFPWRMIKKLILFIRKTGIYTSETKPLNRFLNNFLYFVLKSEVDLINKNLLLPFGLTIGGVAQKKYVVNDIKKNK